MSTLPVNFYYSVKIEVASGEMDEPPQWGFSHGYTLSYIKSRVNVHLNELGYELVRLRQHLDDDVSIEVRTQEVFENILRRAKRLEEHPLIELVAHVRPM